MLDLLVFPYKLNIHKHGAEENLVRIFKLDGPDRAAAKQASRDRDLSRLASGDVGQGELRRENSFFASLDVSKLKMVAIGGRPIETRRTLQE